MSEMARLLSTFAGPGRIDWIGLRPARKAPVEAVQEAGLRVSGVDGDRSREGKRAVTLVQAEHLPVIGALARSGAIAPGVLRRNIVVSGINLAALRNHPVRVGTALIRFTTVCAPCSRMEAAIGPGGYNAMRGHGGWCAEVLEPGRIAVGDPVMRDGADS